MPDVSRLDPTRQLLRAPVRAASSFLHTPLPAAQAFLTTAKWGRIRDPSADAKSTGPPPHGAKPHTPTPARGILGRGEQGSVGSFEKPARCNLVTLPPLPHGRRHWHGTGGGCVFSGAGIRGGAARGGRVFFVWPTPRTPEEIGGEKSGIRGGGVWRRFVTH